MPLVAPEQPNVVIIGAGPAGLTAAYELSKHNVPAVVLEADKTVGGISRTVNYKGYLFDIGGHRFQNGMKSIRSGTRFCRTSSWRGHGFPAFFTARSFFIIRCGPRMLFLVLDRSKPCGSFSAIFGRGLSITTMSRIWSSG